MNKLYGKIYVAVYKTASEKTRRALSKWHDDLVLLGVRGECKGVPGEVLDEIAEEVENIGNTQEARSAAGRKGNAVRWSQTDTQEESQTASQTQSQKESQEASQTASQTYHIGKGILGGKPPKTPTREHPKPRARVREEAAAKPEAPPPAPAADPVAEAEAAGYGLYAEIAPKLSALGLPNGVGLADMFAKAEQFELTPEDVLAFASYYSAREWEFTTPDGHKAKRIGPHTLGGALSRWRLNKTNFDNGGKHGSGKGNRSGTRSAERSGERVFDPSRPVQVQRGGYNGNGDPGF